MERHHECDFCNYIHRVALKTEIPIEVDVSINWEWIYNYFNRHPDATLTNFKHDIAMILELDEQTLMKISRPTPHTSKMKLKHALSRLDELQSKKNKELNKRGE